ncbi:MAG TPA: hypothetical protein VKM56_07665, partial [Verrucomicrobiae bacterium]|nr:hypothetical protein [Verrucomicrobiae bacterium]
MSSLGWYWRRLRAMDAPEITGRLLQKARAFADERRKPGWRAVSLQSKGAFPKLPNPAAAPPELKNALQRDVDAIMKGQWVAFGHLPLNIDAPPKWHCDYLVRQELFTDRSAFRLDHRQLPAGGDIKLIWELSRWSQLVRLAQAGWLLANKTAAGKCIDWLRDWTRHNVPFTGWNWTSALEVGIRLIQFTWIDA